MDYNRERRNDRSPGFNVGSASIIMVFAVLCLTIFSVLSLITTNSDVKLSRRAAKSLEDFYSAEFHAESTVLEIHDKLKAEGSPALLLGSMEGVFVVDEGSQTVIRFVQSIDDKRDLRVALNFDSNRQLSVAEWKVLPNDNWNPESGTGVWQGN